MGFSYILLSRIWTAYIPSEVKPFYLFFIQKNLQTEIKGFFSLKNNTAKFFIPIYFHDKMNDSASQLKIIIANVNGLELG